VAGRAHAGALGLIGATKTVEFLQPGGSVKDRAAYAAITRALERGTLRGGQTRARPPLRGRHVGGQ